MKVFKELVPLTITLKPCIFLFGTFDGVHVGHQYLFQKAVDLAKESGVEAVILTFQNHPTTVLRPQNVLGRLLSPKKKMALIENFGFDVMIDLVFTQTVANLSAEEFFSKLQGMVVFHTFLAGSDVAFGKDRKGDKEYLLAKAKELNFQMLFLEKFMVDEVVVSSSLIRRSIQEAQFNKARKLLGRPYALTCTIVEKKPKLIVDADGFVLPPCGNYYACIRKENESCFYKARVHVLVNNQLEITLEDRFMFDDCKSLEVQFEEVYSFPRLNIGE